MVKQVFLENVPLAEANQRYLETLRALGAMSYTPTETIPIRDSVGRITSEAIRAKICSPFYHASAMDGFAVRAQATFGASEASPLRLELDVDAFVVDTGDPLPDGCNAVIRIEDVSFPAENLIEINLGAVPWQHVRVMGEDLVATEMILPANHCIRPVDVAALYAGGLTEVPVRAKPRVAILPTGTELVEPGEPLQAGSIIEFNSQMLGTMVEELGGKVQRFPISIDDYGLILDRVCQAVEEADIIIVNAGSSAGREDFTSSIISELGEVVVHGVGIKPGKPVILGYIGTTPVIGLPGYPGSTHLTFTLFVAPILAAKLGWQPQSEHAEAILTRKLVSPLGVDEFVRVKLGQVGDKLTATPLARGAGLVSAMVKSDGIIQVPRLNEGYHAGQKVKVQLLRPIGEILQTIVAIGSHDPAMDILGDILHCTNSQYYMSSAHVGSLGGLLTLRRGEAHLAGIHLLDEQTGEYNHAHVAKLLPDLPVTLVNMAYRVQGFIVPPGNPKGIRELKDLAREDVSFINRQGGSGTRVLLDYMLKQSGLSPDRILGYEREEFTHMAVAAAVAGGSADCGLGVWSAAQALGLDFIPVTEERFDLCIVNSYLELPLVQAMLEVLRSEEFKTRVTGLGGYDLRDTGNFMTR